MPTNTAQSDPRRRSKPPTYRFATRKTGLADSQDTGARTALERVSDLTDIKLEGRTLRARARDGGAAIPAVLAALDAHGVKATSVTLARPSLEDVYLQHAGRAFHRADNNHEGAA